MKTITERLFGSFRRNALPHAAGLGLLLVFFAASGGARAHAASAPVADQVPARFLPPAPAAQSLGGLLGERIKTNLVGRLLSVDEAGLLDGFQHRPGKQDWIGEHVGKFLDAAARVYEQTHDERLQTLMTRIARALVATQKSDGYLGTYTDDARWTSWDVWVHKYDLMGLLTYHRVTGDHAALAASRKVGDLLVRTFGDGAGQRDIVKAGTHIGMAATSVLGPMVSLYKVTGDERYLAFCRYLLRAIEEPNGPHILSNLRATGRVFRTANSKAYEMISNLNGLVDLYALTGERALVEPVLAAWKDIVTHRLYPTGSTSSAEHFQDDDVLPGERRDNIAETCVTVNWIELNQRLFRLTGEVRYADEIERAVYNHLLGAQDAKNGDFCYYTPLHGKKPYGHEINCCLSSGPRGMSLLPELAWGRLDRGVVVSLWSAGKMKVDLPGGAVSLTSESRFPNDGAVTLTVWPAKRAAFPLYLRVPSWATRFSATVGAERFTGIAGQYLVLDRAWKPGERVRIEMDLPLRLLPGGKSYPDRVAVQRGPQVLALDAGLNPQVPRADLVALDLRDGALALTDATASLTPETASAAWKARARIAKPGPDLARAGKAPTSDGEVLLVPYADAREPRVWLLRPETLAPAVEQLAALLKSRMTLPIARAAAPPRIDGHLDDKGWRIETPVARAVRGTPRNKVTFGAQWDDQNLYVAVRVLDPALEIVTKDSSHNADNVQVAIDPGMPGLPSPILLTKVWNRGDLEGPVLPGVQHAWAPLPGGYGVELAIPWKALGFQPGAGRSLGFDVVNTDAVPPPGKRNKLQWSSPKEGVESDVENYGRLELSQGAPPRS